MEAENYDFWTNQVNRKGAPTAEAALYALETAAAVMREAIHCKRLMLRAIFIAGIPCFPEDAALRKTIETKFSEIEKAIRKFKK